MASRELVELSKSLPVADQYKKKDINTMDSNVNTDFRSLNTSADSSPASQALSSMAGSMDSFNREKKTIMETFADRASLAREGGRASRELIARDAQTSIEDQLEANSRDYISAQEGRAGFGTQTAAVKFLEESGAKRIRNLEKTRDSLLLEAKVQEASRLDNLINQEQEAITNARTNWINSLLSITGEERAQSAEQRAQMSFETPQEARMRELDIGNQQANQEAVRSLAMTAPDANILITDSYDDAVAKYRNSETYRRNEEAAELQLEEMEAGIANTRSLTNARNNPPSTSNPTGIFTNAPSGDPELDQTRTELDRVAGNVMNLIQSENGKEAFERSYAMARTDAERIDAISSAVLANSPAEVRNDFRQQSDGMRQLDEAIALIDQGIETGVLNSGTQYLYNVVGKDFDEDLAAIDAYIVAALQPYRSSITGAAWGRQEDAEYQKLFGSSKYEPEELRSRLVRLKSILNNKSINAITNQVSPFGGSTFNLFQDSMSGDGGATAQTTPSGMFSDDDF